MRGKRIIKELSTTILPEQTLFPEKETSLYEEKVKLLTARYYYYLNVHEPRMRYEEILTTLSKEFFVSTGRIADILTDNTDEILQLRKDAPKHSWFKLNWAYLVW